MKRRGQIWIEIEVLIKASYTKSVIEDCCPLLRVTVCYSASQFVIENSMRSSGLLFVIQGMNPFWISTLCDALTHSRGLQPVIMSHGMSLNSQSIVGKSVPCSDA